MKHVKTLSLVTVAAMALMAFAASSASATALYNGATKLGVGSELDFTLKSGIRSLLAETGGSALNECSGMTVKGSISNAGGASATVSGNISSVTWTTCTFTTTLITNGGLEVHQIGTSTEGTVTANAEIGWTINTIFWGSCVFGVSKSTDLGTLKTSVSGSAEFVVNAVVKKLSGSSIACPETANWRATLVSTTPDNLRVESS